MQQVVQRGLLKVEKIDGAKNIADVGTKHVSRETLAKLLGFMRLYIIDGRSAALPSLHASLDLS